MLCGAATAFVLAANPKRAHGFPGEPDSNHEHPRPMADILLVVALALLFATTVTAHVAIVAGLARRTPRWRALVALVVPVMAPIWALTEGMRIRAGLWCAALVSYVLLRLLSH